MILYTEISNFTIYNFYSFVCAVITPNRGMNIGEVMHSVVYPMDAMIIYLKNNLKREFDKIN